MNITYMMRRPAYFPEPNKFDPERWIENADGSLNPKAPKGIPIQSEMFFSLGAHVCLGARLASMELRLGIAKLCQAYELSLPAGVDPADTAIPCAAELILKPSSCNIILTPVA
jgi:cytochrome P450